jgi:large subunit ribosomal protein L3
MSQGLIEEVISLITRIIKNCCPQVLLARILLFLAGHHASFLFFRKDGYYSGIILESENHLESENYMKFISGKKLAMTQLWIGDRVWGATPVAAGPCVVVQVKEPVRDGYAALQIGYGVRKEKNIKKPQLGRLKNLAIRPQYLKEFRLETAGSFKVGDIVSVETFTVGDRVAVSGTSKGKGFQGVVKRHGFHGFRKTHGNKDQERASGSVGPKGPARVFKGTRMGGRMGGSQVTTANLEIIKIDELNNILYIKGAVPGAVNGFVSVQAPGELQVNLKTATAAEVSAKTDAAIAVKTDEASIDEAQRAAEVVAVDSVPAAEDQPAQPEAEQSEVKQTETN